MNHFPINWQNGMKINQAHFQGQANAMTEAAAWGRAAMISPLETGLIAHDRKGLEWDLVQDNNDQLTIRLQRCQGISTGGYLIQISEESGIQEQRTVSLPKLVESFGQNAVLLLLLQQDPFESQGHGRPNPEEHPPRIPFSRPTYKIHLVRQDEDPKLLFGSMNIIFGRLILESGEIRKDMQYLPPVRTMGAIPELVSMYRAWESSCKNIFQHCLKLARRADYMQKSASSVISTDSGKTITVSDTARLFAHAVSHAFSAIIPRLSAIGGSMAPVEVHILFQEAALKITAILETEEGKAFEYFRNYLEHAKVGHIWDSLKTMRESVYIHQKIRQSMVTPIEQMLNALSATLDPTEGLPSKDLNFKKDFGVNINVNDIPANQEPENNSTTSYPTPEPRKDDEISFF